MAGTIQEYDYQWSSYCADLLDHDAVTCGTRPETHFTTEQICLFVWHTDQAWGLSPDFQPGELQLMISSNQPFLTAPQSSSVLVLQLVWSERDICNLIQHFNRSTGLKFIKGSWVTARKEWTLGEYPTILQMLQLPAKNKHCALCLWSAMRDTTDQNKRLKSAYESRWCSPAQMNNHRIPYHMYTVNLTWPVFIIHSHFPDNYVSTKCWLGSSFQPLLVWPYWTLGCLCTWTASLWSPHPWWSHQQSASRQSCQ